MFFIWLHYGGRLLAPERSWPLNEAKGVICVPHRRLRYDIVDYVDLENLYLLAHSYRISKLKNDIMTQLVLRYDVSQVRVEETVERLVHLRLGLESRFIKFVIETLAYRW